MELHGSINKRFEPVRDAFAAALQSPVGAGAAVAVWCDGDWVVDLWGGRAGASGSRSWERDSIAMTYSTTKAFAAMCALVLVDRGVLELDAPVQRYWPEFGAAATVRHVLSHQAGVVALDAPALTEMFYNWDGLCRLLADQEAQWTPGTGLGECALFYGHLAGELIRRADGRTLGTFLRQEVCGPLGLDFYVGLTAAEQTRVVDLTGVDEDFRRANSEGRPSLYHRAISNPPGAQDADVVNSSAWRQAEIPAINGHGTARAVAGLYAALLQGELLSEAVLSEATSVQCSGPELVLGDVGAWGLGMSVDSDGYGMGGLGGSMGAASTVGRYAFGFVPGHMGTHDRSDAIENALRSCLGLPSLA